MFNRLEVDQGFVTVLMYHGLETDSERLSANPLDITPSSCIDEITFYRDQGYEVIGVDQLEDIAGDGNAAAAYLVVSFDDGHLNTFEPIRHMLMEERIPIMLGICPEIIERNGIYWWEEARARFEGLPEEGVDITLAGTKVHCQAGGAATFEEACRSVANDVLLGAMVQLRQATAHYDEERIRESRFVHQNMGWDHLGELVSTGLCTLAAHGLAHQIATKLTSEQLRANSLRCRQLIVAGAGVDAQHYVYANGICSAETDRVLADCGYRRTYSTKGARNRLGSLELRLDRYHGFGKQPAEMDKFTWMWNQRHPLTSTA